MPVWAIGRGMRTLEGRPPPADRDHVRARLRSESGVGLIELLIALFLLNIGILAIVAVFSSSAVAVGRASRISTAGALADAQLELYRAIPNASIALDTSSVTTANQDATYTS